MLDKIKNRKQEGFTIIEVLIVLAIAGLIMLIVFLAVPALQRGSRNRGREADASLLASAVNDCVSNNNGKVANCQAIAANKVNYNATDANQLTTAPAYGSGTGTTLQAKWYFGQKCDGSTAVPSTNARQVTVVFKVETTTGDADRCLST